jgi:Golgi apyrase
VVTKKHWTLKTHPGVSTFGETPERVGPDHLQPLLQHALQYVPKDAVKDTPFFLLATAGMRMLPREQQRQVIDQICQYTRQNTRFLLPDCDLHIQIIPGETEGLYGWIAANYLLGGFDDPAGHNHGKGHHTYGFLDMGGASAQIAFAPNATEAEKHANDLKLLRLRNIVGSEQEYRVFVTTWLGFGANEARKRYIQSLQDSTNPGVMELPDPCLPKGLELTISGEQIKHDSEGSSGGKPYLLGTGRFEECLRQTYPLLEKDKPCNDDPCLLGGIHVPAIDFDVNHFVGVSEYWHTTHEIFEMSHHGKAYDFHTYQSRVDEFCSQSWETIEAGLKRHKWGKKVDQSTAGAICFKASWLINMLHDGIGIPRVGIEGVAPGSKNVTDHLVESAKKKGFLDPFQAVNKIDNVEVSWTLGKILLYASSQVPPNDDRLPVGFGTNVPGIAIPTDFQRPGGAVATITEPDHVLDEGDWSDTLFDDSPRRIPGLLLFMLIICVVVYFLCGRERRKALTAKVFILLGLGGRKRRPGSSGGSSRVRKLFGLSPSPQYERVGLSDGGELGLDVELPGYDSDDSAGAEGRASGWATPKLVVDNGEIGSPGKRTLLSEGLLSRTESRDHLAPGVEPRAGRSRSPAIRGKESVD